MAAAATDMGDRPKEKKISLSTKPNSTSDI